MPGYCPSCSRRLWRFDRKCVIKHGVCTLCAKYRAAEKPEKHCDNCMTEIFPYQREYALKYRLCSYCRIFNKIEENKNGGILPKV